MLPNFLGPNRLFSLVCRERDANPLNLRAWRAETLTHITAGCASRTPVLPITSEDGESFVTDDEAHRVEESCRETIPVARTTGGVLVTLRVIVDGG